MWYLLCAVGLLVLIAINLVLLSWLMVICYFTPRPAQPVIHIGTLERSPHATEIHSHAR